MGEQSFHDFLGKTRDDYFLGEDEARIIRLLDIRFVQSSHFLMKGIGGKRALIQYYNYVHLSNNDPNFMCMTIDDNITSVYNKMMPMIYQGVCEPCAAEYSQYWQYISQFCTFVDKVNNKEATTIIVDGVDILKPLGKKRALDNSAADGADGADGRGAQRTKTKKGGKRRRRSKAKTSKQR